MTDPASHALYIDHVSAGYGGPPVIDDIFLEIPTGSCFGLMGLNGAGKTTLIKVILGLREAEQGRALIFGSDNLQGHAKARMAFLPERFDPPWFLTGLEFIKFSLKLYKKTMDEDVVYDYADRLDLNKDALKKRVQTYSKGMRQKLGILATVLTDCELLILDEPMSGLDPSARARVKDVMRDVIASGRTLFLSSHILADMEEICDHSAVLHNHKIRFSGPPKKLVKQMDTDNLERAFLKLSEKK